VLSQLSRSQRIVLALTLLIAAATVLIGGLVHTPPARTSPVAFGIDMSIQQIAPHLDVTGKSFARELGLPLAAPKNRPLKTLGVTQQQLDHATEHLLGHRDAVLKYYFFAALALLGLVYLVRLGRPDNTKPAQRRSWYPRWPYVLCLMLSVAVCGFALGKSPNPMEGAVKAFKSMVGLYPSVTAKVLALCFFAALAVVGNKLICGWACPFGALQELIYHVPILKRLKKRRIPFVVTNSIRAVLFVVALLLLFGVIGGKQGFVVYHYLNPFNLFNFDIESWTVGLVIGLSLVTSLGFYRPFCQFICPFGLLSWLFERVSLFRVRIDHNRCIQCGACDEACPLDAAKGILARKRFPADCFSCGRCLNVCPTDAIRYEAVWKKHGAMENRKG